MRPSPSLRGRILAAYVLLALFLGATFSAIGFKILDALENQLVDQRLEEAADTLIDDHLRGIDHRLPGYPTVLHASALASALRGLPPGLHELRSTHQHLHILIR